MTEENGPGFRVTLRDVDKKVDDFAKETRDELVSIRTILQRVADVTPSQQVQLNDHEKRIRALETRVWAAIGGFGLLAAAAPYLSRLIP